MSLAAKIQEAERQLRTEENMVRAALAMRAVTNNTAVHQGIDTKIRTGERNIAYLRSALDELRAQASGAPSSTSSVPPRTSSDPRHRDLPPPPGPDAVTGDNRPYPERTPGFGQDGRMGMLEAAAAQGTVGEKKRPTQNYTNLDLLKYDTPLNVVKISRMIHQLDFKLRVERQYKASIDKISKLYTAEGDKKSRLEAQAKAIENEAKTQILERALKAYSSLNILGEAPDDLTDPEDRKGNLRKPLTGALMISVKSAIDLEHVPLKGRTPSDTIVVVKIEDIPQARTYPSRTDRWNENFEIHVDKANEVEIAIYDKSGHTMTPIGFLWLRLSDIVEELRKKKAGQDGGGWVPASAVAQGGGGGGDVPIGQAEGYAPPGGQGGFQPQGGFGGPGAQGLGQGQGQQGQPAEGIKAFFSVEPAGAIELELNFVKSNVRKRPYDAGALGRQGAVRRKGETFLQNGHKFVQKQFYVPIQCALCSDLIKNAYAVQCEDCRFLCHEKCYKSVVTKCISKSNEGDKDEDKINHRIPHRFEPITNFAANWCCHCGMIISLGRRNARKCSECGKTAHADCTHLVPDFCGLSMQTANILLAEKQRANQLKQRKMAGVAPNIGTPVRPRPSGSPAPESPTSAGVEKPGFGSGSQGRPSMDSTDSTLSSSTANLSLGGQRPPPGGAVGANGGPEKQGSMGMPNAQPYYGPGQQQGRPGAPQYPPYPGQPGYGQPPTDPYAQQGPPGAATDPYGRPQLPVRPGEPQQQGWPQQQQQQQQPGHGGQVATRPSYGGRPQQQQPGAVGPVASKRSRRYGLDDFNFLAVLGKGNFGKVMLAEEKRSAKLYAIKVLKKGFIIEHDEVESTKSEKRVFLTAARERHPFLLNLHSCFQTETRVYFVMEYVSGGDLMLHIQREQFSRNRAKFYGAEVLLALEYFHKNGIVYRDLKLDNILIGLDGHIKIADYGLCKENLYYGDTTTTFCGTPEFMAPEIILDQKYGRAVDWWAFGVLMYEMLLGQSPFKGEDEDEIWDAILEDEPLYPIQMHVDSVSILQKLLTRDPARRLGAGPDDAEPIKRQPFFADVDWDAMMHKRIPPPFFPTTNGETDTQNFDSEFTSEQPTLTPVHTTLTLEQQREFGGFSWTAPWVTE